MRYIYVGIILALGLAFSCSKMEDNFKGYMEREKTLYAGKVDSVSIKVGYNRIQFEISNSIQNIESIRIFWNGFADSIDVAINGQSGIFSKIVPDIAERDYTFQMVSIDNNGNRSLPFSVPGKVYGDQYLAFRTIRPIMNLQLIDPENMTINWNGIVDDGIFCDIAYFDTLGNETTLRVPMAETSTTINGIDVRAGFSYTTVYMPEMDAIDEFVSAPVRVQPKIIFELGKDTWSLVRLPTDVPGDCYGGSITNLWNNRTNDYYHSGCEGGTNDLIPHHFTIDLGVEVSLSEVQLDPRQGCCQERNPQQFQIWGIPDITDAETALNSNDPDWEQEMVDKGWVKLLDQETPSSWNGSEEGYRTAITDNSSVRYIRYRIMDTWNGEVFTALSEITLWYE